MIKLKNYWNKITFNAPPEKLRIWSYDGLEINDGAMQTISSKCELKIKINSKNNSK